MFILNTPFKSNFVQVQEKPLIFNFPSHDFYCETGEKIPKADSANNLFYDYFRSQFVF